jgi:hypothetical protein
MQKATATVSVGDWTFNLYDEWFNVELWGGGVEKDEACHSTEVCGN